DCPHPAFTNLGKYLVLSFDEREWLCQGISLAPYCKVARNAMSSAVPLETYDVVVIGSGPGGEKGAAQAAYFGKRVALVERAPEVGGASVHTGTLPSKTLRETALYLTGFRRRELYGRRPRLDRKKRPRPPVGRLRHGPAGQPRQTRRTLDRHSVVLVPGFARFEDAKTVAVTDPEGRITRRLGAQVFLIATGSTP